MHPSLRLFPLALVTLGACSGASASGKASGSASLDVQGGALNADAELSAGASGSEPAAPNGAPAPPGSSGWVGADPCGVPDDGASDGTGQTTIALEPSDQPETDYVGTPVATLPGFRMLPGGCSRVFLEMRGAAAVTETRAPGQLRFRLAGVEVPVRTNRFDLPTEHFATPVGKVQLVPLDGGAELVIELRSPALSKAHLRRSPRGTVLTVDFRQAAAGSPAAGG